MWLHIPDLCVQHWKSVQIGDETFIIAALLAMRHPRAIVLSGALSALIIMTVSLFHQHQI
jgi:putative Ca2+/H+ antiporter (TMEM165/GDT1 family)